MDWTATVSGPGNPFIGPYMEDMTFALYGPTGGTSQIILEGTNGSVVSTATWVTLLESVSGAALDYTNVTGGVMVSPRARPRMIRPRFAVVTSGKTLNVNMVARGPLRG